MPVRGAQRFSVSARLLGVLTCVLFGLLATAPSFALDASFFSDLIPNTLAVDLSNDVTVVGLDQRATLVGRGHSMPGVMGEAQTYLRRIGVTRVGLREENKMRFSFGWVPMVTLAFQNLRFDSASVYLAATDFQMFRSSAGIGPELRLDSGFGSLYLNMVPGVSYSWVSWSSPVSGGSMARSNFNLAFNTGIQKNIKGNWSAQLFLREVLEDVQVWDEALDSSQGFDVPVKKVATTTLGASLGYRF